MRNGARSLRSSPESAVALAGCDPVRWLGNTTVMALIWQARSELGTYNGSCLSRIESTAHLQHCLNCSNTRSHVDRHTSLLAQQADGARCELCGQQLVP